MHPAQLQMLMEAAEVELSAAREKLRPSVVYRPGLTLDGNQYCALYGTDLMSGCAGFGDTADAAMRDFDKSWYDHMKRAEKLL